jgi:hypothetical protein
LFARKQTKAWMASARFGIPKSSLWEFEILLSKHPTGSLALHPTKVFHLPTSPYWNFKQRKQFNKMRLSLRGA